MLPSEQIPRFTFWKLLQMTVGMIILLAIINLAAYCYLQRYNPNKAYALIQHKWQLLQRSPAVDWLILGDSSGNQGIDPTLFHQEKSAKAINVCTIADLLVVNDLWQLKAVIQQGKTPKNILLVHTYDIWQRTHIPTGYASQIPAINTDFPLAEYAISIPKRTLMNALPLNFQRASLGHILQHPSQWGKRNYAWEADGFERIEQADRVEVERDTKAHLEFVKDNDFKISTINEKALIALAKLARTEQIKVHLAQAPYHDGLAKNEDFQKYLGQVEMYLMDFCKQNEWIYMTDYQTFSASEMENADHVTMEAAQEFTRGILRQI